MDTQMNDILPVNGWMIQNQPRTDSLLALYLATRTEEGRRAFPNGRNAVVALWKQGTVSQDGRTWRDYRAIGFECIGVLGSPFDEHPSAEFGDGKARKESACLLVAKFIGIDKHPLYKRLIAEVTKADLAMDAGPLYLGAILKEMHRTGLSLKAVIDFAFTAFDTIVASQRQFLAATHEVKNVCKVETVETPNQMPYKLALVRSDNPKAVAATRVLHPNAAIIAVAQSSGHCQIFGGRQFGVNLQYVAAQLRTAEAKARGLETTETIGAACAPGQMQTVPNWALLSDNTQCCNGTETACDVLPTDLNLKQIAEIIRRFAEVGEPVKAQGTPKLKAEKATA